MERRTFLTGLGLLAIPSALQGCSFFLQRPNPKCIFEQHIPVNEGLLIDSHAHFFNGSDLQVAAFVKQVAGRELIDWRWLRDVAGDLLQLIAWQAPNAKTELDLIRQAKACTPDLQNQLLTAKRDEQFELARAEFLTAIKKQALLGLAPPLFAKAHNVAEILPQTYDALYDDSESTSTSSFYNNVDIGKIRAVFRFVAEMFQYRYVSAHNYLKSYNTVDRKIDMVVSHLVDYDWFLAKGKATPSTIPQQIQLMGEIAKLSSGIVNYFAPYCPLRHVAWNLKKTANNFDPLKQIKSAIEEHGAMGVKIYPPMGFSLWGNKELQKRYPDLWSGRQFLPEIRKDSRLGEKLDECLASLYSYCEQNNVPIMAHTAISNLSDDHFNVMFNFDYLEKLVTVDHPNLKISFGHFGGFGWSDDKNEVENKMQRHPTIWRELASMMERSLNNNLFVDTGFFSAALDNESNFRKALQDLLSDHRFLADKMIYGTDWKMLVTEENANQYLKCFEKVLQEPEVVNLVDHSQRGNIFGRNAADFLGLYEGAENNRFRVKNFYQSQKLPHWLSKI